MSVSVLKLILLMCAASGIDIGMLLEYGLGYRKPKTYVFACAQYGMFFLVYIPESSVGRRCTISHIDHFSDGGLDIKVEPDIAGFMTQLMETP
jgi:hypothetical protein